MAENLLRREGSDPSSEKFQSVQLGLRNSAVVAYGGAFIDTLGNKSYKIDAQQVKYYKEQKGIFGKCAYTYEPRFFTDICGESHQCKIENKKRIALQRRH